jgi:WD40 repeat protein/tRNA A-37 threonylcarbamoyl transferase component Bud32
MSARSDESPSLDALLDQVVHDYLEAVDAHGAPDPEELIGAYPELAADLRLFFAGQEEVERLQQAVRAETPAPAVSCVATRELGSPARAGRVPRPGQSFGDYELLEEIARGGMGIVYKARQISLQRVVAVKMILAGQLASAEEVRRFRHEAEAAAQLEHPNIVPIYEVGEHEGQHYFSMQLIEGGCLTAPRGRKPEAGAEPAPDRDSRPALTERRAARLIGTVARAVHHAHQRGILHRDLKPANILLDAAGEPHITDFGLAKRVQGDYRLTQSGAILGTPSYMAPEQAGGEKCHLTTAVDVYSLGAVLHELLTGRPPFIADTPLDILIQVRTREPEPPSRYRPKLPRDLETICMKCLEKDPAKRYATAMALAEDLDRFLAGEPILAHPAGRWRRGVKWAMRRPVEAALILLVLVVAVLGVGGVIWQWRKAEAALVQLANTLYFKRISLAERYAATGDMNRAREALDDGPAELRRWEWHYLKRVCDPEVLRLRGHTDLVENVCYSPDGCSLATASWDETVRIWDANTGAVLRVLPSHLGGAASAAFSPDGRRLATGSIDQTVRVWDLATGEELLALRGAGAYVAFSPDGKRLATGGRDRVVHVWDVRTGEQLVETGQGEGLVHSVAFSADGRQVGAGLGGRWCRVWDAATGRECFNREFVHSSARSQAFSPDGRYLAVIDGNSILLLDPRTGQARENRILTTLDAFSRVAFSKDGHNLAVASRFTGYVAVHEIPTGKVVYDSRAHPTGVASVAFSPNGRCLAVARGRVVTIEVCPRRADPDPPALGVAWNQERSRFALSGEGCHLAILHQGLTTLSVWDVPGRRIAVRISVPVDAKRIEYSPAGRLLACTRTDSGEVQMRDTASGAELPSLGQDSSPGDPALAFSPDGSWLAVTSDKNRVRVWDVGTGKEERALEVAPNATCLSFSPNRERLAVGCQDLVEVWDMRRAKKLRTLGGHKGFIVNVLFSPDGRLIASNDDQAVRIWNAASGKALHTFQGHTGPVQAVAFTPDGQRLVTGGGDGGLKLWDVQTGQEVFRLPGHRVPITFVRFTPDGRQLISGGADGLAKIWDGTPVADEGSD